MSEQVKQHQTFFDRFLDKVERTGNKLPHPAMLFCILAVITLLLSAFFSWLNIEAAHPATGEILRVNNLLTLEGLHRILNEAAPNFVLFPATGPVILSLLAFGLAEYTGLLQTCLRLIVLRTPQKLLTVVVVFTGVISNVASDAGYIVFIPLAALIFLAAGRHPLAGIAAGFAGVSGGYSANLIVGPLEPILAGITTASAQLLDPGYVVTAVGNYYFIAVSTLLVTVLGYLVTEKIVEPRLGQYKKEDAEQSDKLLTISPEERVGLRWAGMTAFVLTAGLIYGLVPESGFLRNLETGDVLTSPAFMGGSITIIFIYFSLVSIAYGLGTGIIKNNYDIVKGFEANGRSVIALIVVFFFAAQFIAYFSWSNIGLIVALRGADFLQQVGAGPLALVLGLIFMSAFVNLFIGSASAKWALMAPVFVPMFMLLGLSPELVQAGYRIGDSVTNIITPAFPYIGLILILMERYYKKTGLGTMMALMLPYSIVFFIGWTIMLVLWIFFGLPLGPGAGLTFDPSIIVN